LAKALGDDPNFATTVANQIGLKADKTYVDNQDAANKTYTDTELEALMNKVIVEVGKKTGAVLR
jgi:phenylalanyl-tRNA synthetase beta subunit